MIIILYVASVLFYLLLSLGCLPFGFVIVLTRGSGLLINRLGVVRLVLLNLFLFSALVWAWAGACALPVAVRGLRPRSSEIINNFNNKAKMSK